MSFEVRERAEFGERQQARLTLDSSGIISLHSAPSWAILAGELGKAFIGLGALAFLGSFIASLMGKAKANSLLFVLGSLCLLSAFACLAALFLGNQFEYQYVFEHGDITYPMKYKVAGVWSGQQGSFLLWAVTSAIFGLLSMRATGIYKRWYLATYSVFLGALCGILSYETPFALIKDIVHEGHVLLPQNGAGLNASLENYWVVVHPPTIFMGFGSLTVMFCFAVSAMITGNLIDWAKLARPWALISMAILGVGICMGGLWAYETLGWGGFWAWDPVENTSFVPWLFVVALLHGIIVQTTKGKWISSNLLMGGLPFIAFVYGTFLTRSGFLDKASLHSFAEMNRSALWILLGVLLASAIGFLILWLVRGVGRGAAAEANASTNRESFYKLGVTLVSLLALSIAIGMSVPFFMAIAGKTAKAVDAQLYHFVVVWFFVPIIALIAIVPFVGWRSLGNAFVARVRDVFCVTIGVTGVCYFIWRLPQLGIDADPQARVALPFGASVPLMPWMTFLMFLCILALVANIWRIAELSKRSKVFSLGGFVAHIGVAVLLAGLIVSRGFERSQQVVAQPGEPVRALDYVVTPGNWSGKSLDDHSAKLPVDIMNGAGVHFTAEPGLYWVNSNDGQQQTMRWPFIYHWFSHDIYLSLADPITTVWAQPKMFAKGQVETANNMFRMQYNGFKMIGKPGQMGTKFVADIDLQFDGQKFHPQPSITIMEGGPQDELVQAGPDFYVSMASMDAATGGANLQVYFAKPIYQMELFYKPMTSLVWMGAGILCLGGLMAAFYRRPRSKGSEPDDSTVENTES